jgi:hypothetical protein
MLRVVKAEDGFEMAKKNADGAMKIYSNSRS